MLPDYTLKRFSLVVYFLIVAFLSEVCILPKMEVLTLDKLHFYRYAYADEVSDGKSTGHDLLNSFSPDNVKDTLSGICLEKDSNGNCIKYMNDSTSTIGDMVPYYDSAVGNLDSLSDHYTQNTQDLGNMQTQGQTSQEYSDFMTNFASNGDDTCLQYDKDGNCILSVNDTTFGNRCLQYDSDGNCVMMSQSYDVFMGSYSDCTKNVTPIYSSGGTEQTCDVDFSNAISQGDEHPCNVTNSASVVNEVLQIKCENVEEVPNQIYMTCTNNYSWYKVFDSHVQSACPISCNQFSGSSPSPYCSNPSHSTSPAPAGSTFLGIGSDNFSEGVGVCSYDLSTWYYDYSTYTYYKNPLTSASYSSPCPSSCSQFTGAFCSGPQNYQTVQPPAGSTFLGFEYANFVYSPGLCSYDVYAWYQDSSNNYYRNWYSNIRHGWPSGSCPARCEDIPGALCSGFPSNMVTVSSPPSDSEYVGNTYENFNNCGYDIYKIYRKLDNSNVERVLLSRNSNCSEQDLTNWSQNCEVKRYEICSPNGSNCVVIIDNFEATGSTNNVCVDVNGSVHQYNICPNSGQSVVELPDDEETDEDDEEIQEEQASIIPIKFNDGSGQRDLHSYPEYSYQYGFAGTVLGRTVYGGSYVKPNLNDWYANVTFTCSEYSETPPECKSLVDQGCIYKEHECIVQDQNATYGCKTYRYHYICGGSGSSNDIVGYDISYVCGNNLIQGLRCMGTECADASYEANKDFTAFVTANEILKQLRMDTDTRDVNNLKIFPGKRMSCLCWPRNCCEELQGSVTVMDYITLAYGAYKAYNLFSVGFTGTVGKTAVALGNLFGGAATFEVSSSAGYTVGTVLADGTKVVDVAFNGCGYTVTVANQTLATLGTIMTAISIAMLVYSIANALYNIIWSCSQNDAKTSMMLGTKRCIYKGKKCTKKVAGICIKKGCRYCCYNSLLAKLVHQYGEKQLTPKGIRFKNCRGFTPQEFQMLDFSKIDLTQYINYVMKCYAKEQHITDPQSFSSNMENAAVGNVGNTSNNLEQQLNDYRNRDWNNLQQDNVNPKD